MRPLDPLTSPADALVALWRNIPMMAACGGTILVGVLLVNAVLAPRFHSEGKFYLRLGRENVSIDPTATIGQGPMVAVPPSREDEINSVVDLLKSRVLRARVVDELGPERILGAEVAAELATESSEGPSAPRGQTFVERLDPRPPDGSPREEAIRLLDDSLDVYAVLKSNVISVDYEADAPDQAQQVLDALMREYVDLHAEINRPSGSYDFFAERTAATQAELRDAETALRAQKDEAGIASNEEGRKLLIQRIATLEDQLANLNLQQLDLQEELAAIGRRIEDTDLSEDDLRAAGYPQVGADAMRARLYDLQLREQEILAKFGERRQQLHDVRKQIAAAREILDREEHRTKLAMLRSLESRQATLRERLAEAERELLTLNAEELELRRLERAANLKDATYRNYATNLEQAEIDRELQSQNISNLVIVQPASYEPLPVSPKKLTNVILGCVAAVVCSAGLAVLRESLRSSTAFGAGDVPTLEGKE